MGKDKVDISGSQLEYQGLPGQTRREVVHHSCQACGLLFGASVYVSINAGTDPTLSECMERGELNVLQCPTCGQTFHPSVPAIYHEPATSTFVLLLPAHMQHRELELRARLLDQLAADPAHIPDYVKRANVTTDLAAYRSAGQQGLSTASIARPDHDAEQPAAQSAGAAASDETDQLAEQWRIREEDIVNREEALLSERVKLTAEKQQLAARWAELEQERQLLSSIFLSLQEHTERSTREVASRPDSSVVDSTLSAAEMIDQAQLPATEVDRWRASEEKQGLLQDQEHVFFLAKVDGERQEAYCRAIPTLRFAFYELDDLPWVVIALLPSQSLATEQVLHWLISVDQPEQKQVLQKLAQQCQLQLLLYDEEARQVGGWTIAAPLAENIAYLLERIAAREGEEKIDPDPIRAAAALSELGPTRFSGRPVGFFPDSFRELLSPGTTALALNSVAHWSMEENEVELLLRRSFPLRSWRELQARVIRSAVDFGLHLPVQLLPLALAHGLAKDEATLLQLLLERFAEVSSYQHPNDLSAVQQWGNWQALFADCLDRGRFVDEKFEGLATAAARHAGISEDDLWPAREYFMRSLPVEIRELTERDILEQEEVLDETDILDEEVEVHDDDILEPS